LALVLVLAWPACTAEARWVYRLSFGANPAGGPVRGAEASTVWSGDVLVVCSARLSPEKQGHFM
jgi:hypothetical protein